MATFRAARLLADPFSSRSSVPLLQLLKPATPTLSTALSHPLANGGHHHHQRRPLATTPSLHKKTPQYPPKPRPPPDTELDESFLKGSGPGGQKINKTNSAVQLKHLPTGIVVKCQETRSRTQNRLIARRLLAERLDDLTKGDQSRSAIVGEAKRKKRASSAKKSRRKYRKLDEERQGVVAGAEGEGEGEGEGGEEELEEQVGNKTLSEGISETASEDHETVSGHNAKVENDQSENMRVHRGINETGKN
ncbi:RF-1 domain-containing protein [Apiospora marii]|uniref:RF-1 domain-containing protein n=1 Tax=Apiospora marii TaxID=335849 RepID=UPI003130404C